MANYFAIKTKSEYIYPHAWGQGRILHSDGPTRVQVQVRVRVKVSVRVRVRVD
jgi:hypothetical protein